MAQRIYLDYNASTPLAPEVARVLQRVMGEGFGNPSSGHWAGTAARSAIDTGRRQVAGLLGCSAPRAKHTPFNARLLASLPPLVNTTSSAEHPSNPAT